MPATSEPLAFTIPQVAGKLGLSERTVWQLVADEKIPSIKIGSSRRVARADLEAYVETLRGVAMTHPDGGGGTGPGGGSGTGPGRDEAEPTERVSAA